MKLTREQNHNIELFKNILIALGCPHRLHVSFVDPDSDEMKDIDGNPSYAVTEVSDMTLKVTASLWKSYKDIEDKGESIEHIIAHEATHVLLDPLHEAYLDILHKYEVNKEVQEVAQYEFCKKIERIVMILEPIVGKVAKELANGQLIVGDVSASIEEKKHGHGNSTGRTSTRQDTRSTKD